MSTGLIMLILFSGFIILLVLGLPMAFCLGGMGTAFLFLFMGPKNAAWLISAYFKNTLDDFLLIAIPMFIFMACMLQSSGIADRLYSTMNHWMGRVKGGLAIGTVMISTILASMVGTSDAAINVMGIAGLPAMLQHKYDKGLSMGVIMAGSALGILIPPSALMLIYSDVAEVPPHHLFLAGIFPGILLTLLYIIYIMVKNASRNETDIDGVSYQKFSLKEKMVSLSGVIAPLFLLVAVMGSIFLGIATTTEAAAVGALGSIVCAAIYRKLSWNSLNKALLKSLKLTCMMMWIIIAAQSFTSAYNLVGFTQVVADFFTDLQMNRWIILISLQILFFIIGCFLDPYSIVMITSPIYIPIVQMLGFDSVWFAILFIMNMQLAYLTPPFGLNLFYMKAVAPPNTMIEEVYRSAIPFVLLQSLGLAIVMALPSIALSLPNHVYQNGGNLTGIFGRQRIELGGPSLTTGGQGQVSFSE